MPALVVAAFAVAACVASPRSAIAHRVDRPTCAQQADQSAVAAPPADEVKPARTRWRSLDYEGHPEYTFRIGDPYHQNILKADFPIAGDWFLELNALNNFTYKSRRNLDFQNAFASDIKSGALPFVAHNNFVNENILFGTEIRRFEDAFVPSTFRLRVNGVADYRRDINAFNPGSQRSALHLFDAFADVKLADFGGSSSFDLLVARGGLQGFKSEFHGLVFNDVGLGARLFGEAKRNRLRYDAAYFKLFRKDPVSAFLDFSQDSQHQVAIGRVAWEDVVPGWNSEWTVHVNHDPRPLLAGAASNAFDTVYPGVTFNGHLGRSTFNPAFVAVFGSRDAVDAGRVVSHSVRAWTGLVDWQFRVDYWTARAGYLHASGDGTPGDTQDSAFDAISDGVTLFGGPASAWVGENIKLGRGDFVRANSLLPALRGANGQANHINPGIDVINGGFDVTVSPRLDTSVNVNVLRFAATGTYDPRVTITDKSAGVEANVFARWKPFLRQANQTVVVDAGFSVLQPGAGLKQVFGSDARAFTALLALRVLY